MRGWVHFLTSAVVIALLYPLIGARALLVLVGGFLVDIDHYFWYIYRYKKADPWKCYLHFDKQISSCDFTESKGALLIFHTMEFLIVMTVLSFYYNSILLILIGLLVHYILDIIYLATAIKSFIIYYSLVGWWLMRKNRH